MIVNNIVFRVIGVAPPAFIGISAIFGPNLWVPATMAEQLLPNDLREVLTSRRKPLFAGVGRLKPGIAPAGNWKFLSTSDFLEDISL